MLNKNAISGPVQIREKNMFSIFHLRLFFKMCRTIFNPQTLTCDRISIQHIIGRQPVEYYL